ncbi:MAG: hypothetical protein AMXMBFR84_44600 [Candidatus Hydrogenedentota bacterium]
MCVLRRLARYPWLLFLVLGGMSLCAPAEDLWVTYDGGDVPGKGKRIVLVSGDEEYRSEEVLPQLGKILAVHHGFHCTVLFATHPDGYIDPNFNVNIPGLDALDAADLLVLFTRFRDLPDEQMEPIERYLKAGKPVIGIRTATHAFNADPSSNWYHYSNGFEGDPQEWKDGFGRLVLGEKWISHHGKHKYESTLGITDPGAESHPIVRGLKEGSIWGATDVYGVRLPLPDGSEPLVLGQVTEHGDVFDENDLHYGMRPETGKPVAGEKNNPMMPIAWTKPYQIPGGAPGKAFTTTIGSSTDFLSEGVRRLMVNAVYWAVGLEESIPAEGTQVALVGDYRPTKFEFRESTYWQERKMTAREHGLAVTK